MRLMKYIILKMSIYVIFPKQRFISSKSFYSNKEVAINHSLLYWHLFTFSNSLNHKLYNAIYLFFSLIPP